MSDLWKKIHTKHPFFQYNPREDADMEGWHVSDTIYEHAVAFSNAKVALEVGSWKGASAITILEAMKKLTTDDPTLICIDTWLGSVEHWELPKTGNTAHEWLKFEHGRPEFYHDFMSNIIGAGFSNNVIPIPQTSSNALKILKRRGITVDFAYIDGSHEQSDVAADLVGYWQVVKPGGIMMGDDLPMPGVRAAFEAFKAIMEIEPEYIDGNFFMFEKGDAGV